jgi:creatinine amidohydrolase
VPCGLLEWHSSHLPLGIDGLKIQELAGRIATKFGGVVMPPFYVGAPGFTS